MHGGAPRTRVGSHTRGVSGRRPRDTGCPPFLLHQMETPYAGHGVPAHYRLVLRAGVQPMRDAETPPPQSNPAEALEWEGNAQQVRVAWRPPC